MCSLQPPPSFVPGVDSAEAWARWEFRFRLYYDAIELRRKPISQQRAHLLHVIGDSALDVYRTFQFEEEGDALTVDVLLSKFASYYQPFKNVTYQRYLFSSVKQEPMQGIDAYVTQLKTLARNCEFGDLEDSLICDKLVSGILDRSVAESLLRKPDLTLVEALTICRAAESSRQQTEKMCQQAEQPLHAIRKKVSTSWNPRTDQHSRGQSLENSKSFFTEADGNKTRKPCCRCGTFHAYRHCPAYGKVCFKCKKKNHFSKKCPQAKICAVTETQDECVSQGFEHKDDTLFIGHIQLNSIHGKSDEWTECVVIQELPLNIKIDTGSQANILPVSFVKSISPSVKLEKTSVVLKTYTNETIPVVGKTDLICRANNRILKLCFYVVDVEAIPILGLPASKSLGYITMVNATTVDSPSCFETLIEEYQDVFEGLGTLPGVHKITLKDDAEPVVESARKIPYSLQNAVRLELERMEKLGVITRISEPTDWGSPIVVVPKPDGSVRICMDPRNLNRAIKREHHHIPVIDSLLSKIFNSKVFTVLDASSAFWQVQLDEESSKMCTIVTPYGRYRFLRLPYGISSAPEVFQKAVDTHFSDLGQVLSYIDDLLLHTSTDTSHLVDLKKVLQRAREINMKFNLEKLQLAKTTVDYVGHRLTGAGVAINPARCEAILRMKTPQNRKELQRVLGMVTYLAKFLPNLSEKTSYLRHLLSVKTVWHWDEQANLAFQNLKQLVSSSPVLSYFDPLKRTTLSVDASQYGLGAVLLQDEKPVMYASAALSGPQTRYSQIEKELLALVYACQRFHYYIYGYEVDVQTDHKPLLSLVKKPFEEITPRLQRMVLKLQRYNLTLHHLPGKLLQVADTLSRAPLDTEKVDTRDIDDNVGSIKVFSLLVATPKRLSDLQAQSLADPEHRELSKYINQGWPTHKRDCTPLVGRYWSYRHDLHVLDGLLFWKNRLLVPATCREDLLKVLHSSHQGVVATKNLAAASLFWPGINAQIEQTVLSCPVCQQYQRNNSNDNLLPHDVPMRSWQKVGVDLFHLNQEVYLIVIDYFSKFVEIHLLSRADSTHVIAALKSTCARYGIPEELFTDNGPPFDSHEMRELCNQWSISHTTSSPGYPRSNGMVERAVQTVKRLLKKSIESNSDPYLALLQYRCTPTTDLPSPAEILFGRRLRTLIPTAPDVLQTSRDNDCRTSLLQRRKSMLKGVPPHRPLPPLQAKQEVNMKTKTGWRPATVVAKTSFPRSYEVVDSHNRQFRRNRVHLRSVPAVGDPGQTLPLAQAGSSQPPGRSSGIPDMYGSNRSIGRLSPVGSTHETRDLPVFTRSGRQVITPARFRE